LSKLKKPVLGLNTMEHILNWTKRMLLGNRSAFNTPIVLASLIGIPMAAIFYIALTRFGFEKTLLYRYAMCHLVAQVSVFMFAVALVSMILKLVQAKIESYRTSSSRRVLRDLVKSAPDESPVGAADWLEKVWFAQANSIKNSWLGQRVAEVVSRQTARGTCRHLEEDLKDLADKDADSQHDSYGLVRIVSWAMPMFGFLGTVIGISETLGRMDTKALASGSQDAMNSLTAGLYVAFDTTAVGLVLTMAAMFAMFVISSVETRLLTTIDREVNDNLQGLLCEDDSQPKDIYRVEETIRLVSQQFVSVVENLVTKQAELWQSSIDTAQARWSTIAASATETSRDILSSALDSSLDRHIVKFEKTQTDGAAQLDARYQQWQTTLSEQARLMHAHQGELVRQTELLADLIHKGEQLQNIEEGLQQNLVRLTDIDRFHEAAVVLAEGVAVLGTQLERSGYLKPRMLRKIPNAPPNNEIRRKAA
jgi:biopolymer transport protein ExbB/TolQ